jgi:hypothetical protein
MPKLTPSANAIAEFIVRQNDQHSSLILNSPVPIGGFVFELPINSANFENIEVNPDLGLDIRVTRRTDCLRVTAFSLEGNTIPEGEVEILTFNTTQEIIPNANIAISDIAGGLLTGVFKIELPLPTALSISAMYPNPFNSTILIECALPADDNVTLKIYDIAGRIVTDFDLGQQAAGYHRIAWNGTNSFGVQVSTGIYFARLESNITHQSGETRKLTLIK